jgi:hypothetical protein
MVLIDRPGDSVVGDAGAEPAPTPHESDVESLASASADADANRLATTSDTQCQAAAADDGQQVAVQASAAQPCAAPGREQGPEDLAPEELATSAPLPSEQWAFPGTQRRQQWGLMLAGAIAGIVLALGVFGFLVSRALAPQQPQATSTTPPVTSADSDSVGAPSADSTRSGEPSPDAATPEPGVVGSLEAGESTGPTGETTAAEPATPSDTTPSGTPRSTVAQAEAHTPDSEPDEDAAPNASGLNATAQEMDNRSTEPGESGPGSEPATDAAASTSLAQTLETFAPFIDPEAFVPRPAEPPSLPTAKPELDPDAAQDTAQRVPRPEPREVDVEQRLKDTIPSIEFREVPLRDFVRFVTGFSTIPISLDPDALTLVGARADVPVSVQQTDTTVGRVLTEALAPLGLGFEVLGDQLLVTRVAPADTPLRTLKHPVDDLVSGDPAQLNQLASLIVDMVEPEAWDVLGGQGTLEQEMPSLVIRQRDTVLFRVIVFCERLRAARGLPPQSRFDPSLFALEPSFVRIEQALRRPVTLNYLEPAALTRIVDQLSQNSGLDILIDWRALADLGWNPDAETTLSANGEAVGDVLASLLRPLDLNYRVIDQGCVQITSPDQLETALDVEFYAAADLRSGDVSDDPFTAQIAAQLGDDVLDDVGGTLYLDPPSGYLIAALPQPVQRKLAAVLAARRSAAP